MNFLLFLISDLPVCSFVFVLFHLRKEINQATAVVQAQYFLLLLTVLRILLCFLGQKRENLVWERRKIALDERGEVVEWLVFLN